MIYRVKQYTVKLLSQVLKELVSEGAIASSPTIDVTFPDPQFGDYASNLALQLAKREGKNPKELAETIISKLTSLDTEKAFESITALGGFINFTLSAEYLLKNVSAILIEKENYGNSQIGNGKTIVVEYFQNNVAKPPHVGHLRSAVIGDSILRILRSQGYQAISDTHIGDWGVQFGILLYAFKTMGDRSAIEKDPINELNKLYVAVSNKIEQQPELRDLGKAEFRKLEDGDSENRALWQWFVSVSMKDFQRYRQLLGLLEFDHNLGESFYEEHMPRVLEEFQQKGLIIKGEDGELYVDLESDGLGRCILIKSDGATTYHMRDFATYIYRKQEFNFYRNLYVVDNRQAHHFKQLFKVLEKAGYEASADSEHVDFGFMSLPEGAISSRKGTTISLENLLSEAEKRALAIIDEKNPTLHNKDAVSKLVARAAIKYFDLSHNRKTEFVFIWDKALTFDGNTGPYLQYTHARIFGIRRKSTVNSQQLTVNLDSSQLQSAELAILRKLNQFPDMLVQVSESYLPNLLCNYLFELSQTFNSFYQDIPVLQETDEALRSFRLQLVQAVAQVLANGLYLLGIEAVEEM